MNNGIRRAILQLLQIVCGILLCITIWGGGTKSSYGIAMVVRIFLTVGMLMLIIITWFYLKFRIRKDEYDFNMAEYKKERADIEEKIRELQDAINYNDDAWKDNNHLILSGQEVCIGSQIDINKALENQFGVIKNLKIIPKKAFMLMPFTYEAAGIFVQCRESALKLGFTLKKSDDEYIEGDLLRNIVENIITSEIIIANLDGKNPNVFYELGIAHTLGKKTILISSYRPEEMPFNIKNKYIIFYQTMNELNEKLINALEQLDQKHL